MADDPAWRPVPAAEGWLVGPVSPELAVRVGAPPPPLATDLADLVSRHWEEARRDRPHLFNGRVFSVDRISAVAVEGHWTEYRRILAQLRQPELFDALHLRPLAVNGLLECDDGLLLGRRGADAVYMPSRWQAAPAGNVEHRADDGDSVNLAAQLLAELGEELGAPPACVSAARPVLAIEHALTHVVDIGFLLRVALPFSAVTDAARRTGNREYDAFRLVPRSQVRAAIAELGPSLLPSAHALLEAWTDLLPDPGA